MTCHNATYDEGLILNLQGDGRDFEMAAYVWDTKVR